MNFKLASLNTQQTSLLFALGVWLVDLILQLNGFKYQLPEVIAEIILAPYVIELAAKGTKVVQAKIEEKIEQKAEVKAVATLEALTKPQ